MLSKGSSRRLILWFRNDLRVSDNAVLDYAYKFAKHNGPLQVLPLYTFDPRFTTKKVSRYGITKCEAHRMQFTIEAVANLRKNLRALGSDLLVSDLKAEDCIAQVAREFDCQIVYQQETCSEEQAVERAVKSLGHQMVPQWSSHLLHVDDLPPFTKKFPSSYTAFRQATDKVQVRPPLPTPPANGIPYPEQLTEFEAKAKSWLPTLEHFGLKSFKKDPRQVIDFRGGEDEAQKRLAGYIKSRALDNYKKTRNDMLGENASSKFSPWLAQGSISVRQIYQAVVNYPVQNASTQHFIDELFWRDFFCFYARHHGTSLFFEYGVHGKGVHQWREDLELIERWRQGTTGMPLIDACMRELNQTGWMSNRGRQVVASYLALDLKQDWRYGAHYFEQMLVDHDVRSNYGGWSACAGLGPGRVNFFNSLLQSQKYDPEGEYIKTWVPELQRVPVNYIHDVWNMPAGLQKKLRLQIGGAAEEGVQWYPQAIASRYTTKESAKEYVKAK